MPTSNDNTLYMTAMVDKGRSDALDFQARSAEMTGTEMYAEDTKIPAFQTARTTKNMLEREVGFICKSSAGRVVRLLQVYDSTIYTQEPEELPAQWGFVWSTDPAKALPFVAISTSPYMIGDCCLENGVVYRSTIDNNVWAPSAYPQGWELATDEPYVPPVTEPSVPDEPETGGETPGVPEFVQPTGGHDAYSAGDRVMYNGKVYESLIDNNVWSPDTYPRGWSEVA